MILFVVGQEAFVTAAEQSGAGAAVLAAGRSLPQEPGAGPALSRIAGASAGQGLVLPTAFPAALGAPWWVSAGRELAGQCLTGQPWDHFWSQHHRAAPFVSLMGPSMWGQVPRLPCPGFFCCFPPAVSWGLWSLPGSKGCEAKVGGDSSRCGERPSLSQSWGLLGDLRHWAGLPHGALRFAYSAALKPIFLLLLFAPFPAFLQRPSALSLLQT